VNPKSIKDPITRNETNNLFVPKGFLEIAERNNLHYNMIDTAGSKILQILFSETTEDFW